MCSKEDIFEEDPWPKRKESWIPRYSVLPKVIEVMSTFSNPKTKQYLYSESTDEAAKAQQNGKSRMITMHLVRIEEYIITKSGIADYE